MNEESILLTIKKMIGGDIDSDEFDTDLIVSINSVIATLCQIGIESLNKETGADFAITGENETWDDYLGNFKHVDMIKSYIYQRVRMIFDPPQNSTLISSIQEQIKENEWRIMVAAESDDSKSNN